MDGYDADNYENYYFFFSSDKISMKIDSIKIDIFKFNERDYS